jgi:5-methylcytosine-specific restriction endonuclease McrA
MCRRPPVSQKTLCAEHAIVSRAHSKTWEARNPEKKPTYLRTRGLARRSIAQTMARGEIVALLQTPCIYCGEVATSIDHVLPLDLQRRHLWPFLDTMPERKNAVAACRSDNSSKVNRTPAEWGRPFLYMPTGLDRRVLSHCGLLPKSNRAA